MDKDKQNKWMADRLNEIRYPHDQEFSSHVILALNHGHLLVCKRFPDGAFWASSGPGQLFKRRVVVKNLEGKKTGEASW